MCNKCGLYYRLRAEPEFLTAKSHDISSSSTSIRLRRSSERQRLQFTPPLTLLLQQFVNHPELSRVNQHHLPTVSQRRSTEKLTAPTTSHSAWPISSPSTCSAPSNICSLNCFPSFVGTVTRTRIRARCIGRFDDVCSNLMHSETY